MTSSAASAHWGPGRRPLGDVWGHFAPHVLIAAIVSSAVLVVEPAPPGSAVAIGAPVGLVGIVLTTWVLLRRHDRSLCERCVAAMPLDASAAAHRNRRRMWTAHAATRPSALLVMVALLVAVDVALVVVPATWVGAVSWGWAAAQGGLVYLVLSHTTHRRLQPWCPWCRDGGGGEGLDEPEPVPSDSGRA